MNRDQFNKLYMPTFIYYLILYNNMKERFVKVVRKNGSSFAINLPIEIVKIMDIREGSILRVEIEAIKNEN